MSQLKAESVYPEEQQKAAAFVQSIYHNHADSKALSMPKRLEEMSGLFLDKPYFLGALGEGASGRYDQYPLYRVDAFDCLTFVETVLALSLADNLESFKRMMNKIRYQEGRVSFLRRNHFTDLDWNKHNQENGVLIDVTLSIHDQHQQPIAKIASAVINKPAWYQHFSSSRIRLAKPLADEPSKQRNVSARYSREKSALSDIEKIRLNELKKRGQSLMIQTVSIPYIPLTAIVDASGKANTAILQQIPNGAIVEIVRPNWDLREAIGTSLNVSHLGFAFWRDGILMFRNASTLKGHVVDQPLVDYLRDALQSPTIKGINIQVVAH